MTNSRAFEVAKTDSAVGVMDVDSVRRHVYWIDGIRMRRAVLNANDTLYAQPQDLCNVSDASGIAYDWIARSVEPNTATGWLIYIQSWSVCE